MCDDLARRQLAGRRACISHASSTTAGMLSQLVRVMAMLNGLACLCPVGPGPSCLSVQTALVKYVVSAYGHKPRASREFALRAPGGMPVGCTLHHRAGATAEGKSGR